MPQASILISPRVAATLGPESSEMGGGRSFRNVELSTEVITFNTGDQYLERLTCIGDGRMRTGDFARAGLGLAFEIVGDEAANVLRVIPVVQTPTSQEVDWLVTWGVVRTLNERILLHPSDRIVAHIVRGVDFSISGPYNIDDDSETYCNIEVPGRLFSQEHLLLKLDRHTSLATLPDGDWQVSAGYGVQMQGRNSTTLTFPRVNV